MQIFAFKLCDQVSLLLDRLANEPWPVRPTFFSFSAFSSLQTSSFTIALDQTQLVFRALKKRHKHVQEYRESTPIFWSAYFTNITIWKQASFSNRLCSTAVRIARTRLQHVCTGQTTTPSKQMYFSRVQANVYELVRYLTYWIVCYRGFKNENA